MGRVAQYCGVIGEALVDVVVSDTATPRVHVGGSPLNVAVGLSRLERPVLFAGRLGRDKRLEASLNGRTFTFINENSGDWIIDDVDDEKVGQFTARNSGVRKAILEFEHDAEGLTTAEIAGLSWFTRVILDANTQGKAWAWIITLVLASIVALVALFVL